MQQKVHLDFLEFTPRKRKRNERNNVTNDIPTIRSLNQLLSSRSKMYRKHFPFQNYELQCAWLTYFLIEISSRTYTIYYTYYIRYIILLCHFFLFSEKLMPFRESDHGNKYWLLYSTSCHLFLEASALTSK